MERELSSKDPVESDDTVSKPSTDVQAEVPLDTPIPKRQPPLDAPMP